MIVVYLALFAAYIIGMIAYFDITNLPMTKKNCWLSLLWPIFTVKELVWVLLMLLEDGVNFVSIMIGTNYQHSNLRKTILNFLRKSK